MYEIIRIITTAAQRTSSARSEGKRLVVALADNVDLAAIYRFRHEVYAVELEQYKAQANGILADREDLHSTYIAAKVDGELAGFIGVTPPQSPIFSAAQHASLADIPEYGSDGLFEIRALTVASPYRGRAVSLALMYAAFRWIESAGGTQILAAGRRQYFAMYQALGLEATGQAFTAGAVTYELMTAPVARVREFVERSPLMLDRLCSSLEWNLDVPLRMGEPCYHGGASFDLIGDTFDDLGEQDQVIAADVLDAWFPPAPAVIQALSEHLDWALRTSPPTHADGLRRVIGENRGIDPSCVLPGAGSSDLIFLAMKEWLRPSSRVLVMDPTYGEYIHVLERQIGCCVERFTLSREDGYRVDLTKLAEKLAEGFDLLIWVNPNNPTGLHVESGEVLEVLSRLSEQTRVWVDETYIDYVGVGASIEAYACRSQNVVVCKSLSKALALSGVRAGYLCGPRKLVEALRLLSPPWAVSLPAQLAAIRALRASDYYQQQYSTTHRLRKQLHDGLCALGINEILPGVANYLLFFLPDNIAPPPEVVRRCRSKKLLLREFPDTSLGGRAIRIAVQKEDVNERMLAILGDSL